MRTVYNVQPGLDREDLGGGTQLIKLRRPEVKRLPPVDPPSLKPKRQPQRDDPGAA
jgi:hypothetical protein